MAVVTNKKLDTKMEKLAEELNKILVKHYHKPIRGYRVKICSNQVCIENSKDIVGYLKGNRKNIPVCVFRNFCPDAHFRYFNYRPEYIKKEV